MIPFDDNPPSPDDPGQTQRQDSSPFLQPAPDSPSGVSGDSPAPGVPPLRSQTHFPGDPFSLGAASPTVQPDRVPKFELGDSLGLGLYWLHFVIFGIFSFVSLLIIQLVLLNHYLPLETILRNQAEVQRIFFSKPLVSIGTMVILSGVVLSFLYLTLGVLRGAPFWRSLGWKKIALDSHWPKNPWIYFGAGALLSLIITLASSAMQPPKNAPIEELLRDKNTALLFMAMAVFIAPFVEETVFRGYLYPLLAKSFGVAASILLTGTIFGLFHGMQLGWSHGLVLALIAVGVIFTFVRARTGSVFASFLLHLGYNSTLALFSIIGSEIGGKISPH